MIPRLDRIAPWLAAAEDAIPMHWIIGGVLLFTAVLDLVLAFAVFAPRIADPKPRTVLIGTMSAGALLMSAVGVLVLLRIIPIGG